MQRYDIVLMTFIPEGRQEFVPSYQSLLAYPYQYLVNGPNSIAMANTYDHVEGDDRGFTKGDPTTEKRYRTRVILHLDDVTNTFTKEITSGDSILYDGQGKELKRGTIKEGQSMNHNIRISEFSPEPFRHMVVSVKGSAKTTILTNPMWAVPAIDFDLNIDILRCGNNWTIADLDGVHDGFPNYEVYARQAGQAWKTVYQYDHVAAGKTGFDLLPPMDVTVSSTMYQMLYKNPNSVRWSVTNGRTGATYSYGC